MRKVAPLLRSWIAVVGISLIPTTSNIPETPIKVLIPDNTEVILKFISHEEMAKLTGSTIAIAYSDHWFHPPCKIYLLNTEIEGKLSLLEAKFSDEHSANALAHELLHCTKGYWHPTPLKGDQE